MNTIRNEDRKLTPDLVPDRLYRLPDVLILLGLKKSSFYDGIKTGKYPRQKKLGKISAWRGADLLPIIEQGAA